MENKVKKLLEDKKEYRRQVQRVQQLPDDYQFVYNKMIAYMWAHAGGSGMDMLQTQYDLIDVFEEGVSLHQHVLAITGEDVAGFCDELIIDNTLWSDRVRKRLNKKMDKKFT